MNGFQDVADLLIYRVPRCFRGMEVDQALDSGWVFLREAAILEGLSASSS